MLILMLMLTLVCSIRLKLTADLVIVIAEAVRGARLSDAVLYKGEGIPAHFTKAFLRESGFKGQRGHMGGGYLG